MPHLHFFIYGFVFTFKVPVGNLVFVHLILEFAILFLILMLRSINIGCCSWLYKLVCLFNYFFFDCRWVSVIVLKILLSTCLVAIFFCHSLLMSKVKVFFILCWGRMMIRSRSFSLSVII